MNHTTGPEHVDRVLRLIATADPGEAATPALTERHPDVSGSWVNGANAAAAALRHVPLFAELARAELDEVAANVRARDVAGGAMIVEQWELTREFFVVAAGTVAVFVGDERVGELGPGMFFGELAALDWGAGFGYPRLATVVAQTDTQLLVFPDGELAAIVRRFPAVEARIRRAAEERLPRH